MKYDFKKIEAKWQKKWREEGVHEPDLDKTKHPFYNLMMFPYPSAEGLHVGNVYAFTGSDVYGRFKRMQGNDVFEPMGLDGFGIHSENYAMKVGLHPTELAKKSEKRFYEQLEGIGNGFAWKEKLETYSPEYYRWTQWLFVQLFKQGLAYRKKAPVNWCPSCKTVLADEQVLPVQAGEGGKCERCDSVVEKKDLEQWFFRITKYADKLLKNLETLDWSEKVRVAQMNWIGKSEGALIRFLLRGVPGQADDKHFVDVFTTRPDTIFGATFIVISPEVAKFWIEIGWKASSEVQDYVKKSLAKPREERTNEKREKTGVDTGMKAVNPANKKEIPVWVADYVLGEYGTGAIMAVPAHDERDFDFAKKFELPLMQVIKKPNAPIRSYIMGTKNISKGDLESIGVIVSETMKDGDYKVEIPKGKTQEFEKLIIQKMEPGFWNEYIADDIVFIFKQKDGTIERLVLNDKNVFRIDELACEFTGEQYDPKNPGNYINGAIARNSWYKPIIVHDESGMLMNSGKFDGMNSENAKTEIVKFVGGAIETRYRLRDWLISRQRYWGPPIPMIFCESCAEKNTGEREEMPGWYAVSENQLPVELPYVKDFRPKGEGTSPLASDEKFVNVKCPKCGEKARRETDVSDTFLDSAWYFLRYLDPQNTKTALNDARIKRWLPVSMYIGGAEHSVLHLLYTRFITMALKDAGYIDFDEPFKKFRAHGLIIKDGAKMSKSKGNVVNPDFYLKEFGADALRMYLMFLAPLEDGGDFQENGILGPVRLLERVYTFGKKLEKQNGAETEKSVKVLLNKTIEKVTKDIETLHYNTAISALMIAFNAIEKSGKIAREDFITFVKLMNPFAPHLSQELWELMGEKGFVDTAGWPIIEDSERETTFRLIVQVDGKVRDSLEAPIDISEKEATALALSSKKVKKFIATESQIGKIIFVPNKIINLCRKQSQ